MRKAVSISMVLIFGWAISAYAQVATTEMAPAGARILNSRYKAGADATFTPDNPAAMHWGAPSAFGLGLLNGSSNDGADGSDTKYTGKLFGVRWVAERISFGVESLDYKVEYATPVTVEEKHNSVALAFNWPFESLAIGFSSDTNKLSESTGSSLDVKSTRYGISYRANENFYLAAAAGSDKSTDNAAVDGKRKVLMYGAAFRGGGDWLWRIEYNVTDKKPFENDLGVEVEKGISLQQFAIELSVWDWLLGYRLFDGKDSGTAFTEKIKGYTVDYGYLPLLGLAITGRYEHNERSQSGGGVIGAENINSVNVSYQF